MANVVEGVPEFDGAIAKMNERINQAAKEFVSQGGSEIAARAKESINGNSTDTWHSTAWPVPTSRTNALRTSIELDNVRMLELGVWQSETGPRNLVYARRVELGFHGSGRWPYYTTRPFPYLQPGMQKALPRINQLFKELVIAAQEA
jgi:hypothetical protein